MPSRTPSDAGRRLRPPSRRGSSENDLDPFELKQLARALVVPPALPLLVAVVGLLLARWRPRAGRALLIAGTAGAWLLATPLVAGRLVALAESGAVPLDAAGWEAARLSAHPPGAVVVLGGGAVADGPFSPRRERLKDATLLRVVAGARVARDTGLPVLVSGGRPRWLMHSEAELMRDRLERDLATPVRWVEGRSRDTAENASESAAILKAEGIDSVVLVTQAYHMPRARAAFEARGLTVVPAPHDWMAGPPDGIELGDLIPDAHAVLHGWLAIHELIGRLWYRARGNG